MTHLIYSPTANQVARALIESYKVRCTDDSVRQGLTSELSPVAVPDGQLSYPHSADGFECDAVCFEGPKAGIGGSVRPVNPDQESDTLRNFDILSKFRVVGGCPRSSHAETVCSSTSSIPARAFLVIPKNSLLSFKRCKIVREAS